MEDLQASYRSRGSVWSIALLTVLLFVVLVFFVGLFGAPEQAAVAITK